MSEPPFSSRFSREHIKKPWYLKNIKVFSGLSAEERRELQEITRMESYGKNDYIYLPGEPGDIVYLLKKGRVKISRVSEEGREATLCILEAGEIFGEVEVLGGVQRESVVQAIEPTLVCEISREDFERYVYRNADVGGKVLKVIGHRLRQVETRLSDLVFRSAPARLAKLLLELGDTMGDFDNGGIRIRVRLTHQNLANLIGTSRETVSTLISQFQQQGLIIQEHRYILLMDREQLAQVK